MKRAHCILLNNPPVNALSRQHVDHIHRELNYAEESQEIDIVFILGSESVFSAGADILELQEASEILTSEKEMIMAYTEAYKTHNLAPLVFRIDRFPKPVVALLSGVVMGGGLEIAIGCQYRFCLGECKFQFPEVFLGIIPGALGTQMLPRLVSMKNCIELCVDGKCIDTKRALEIGLVDDMLNRESRSFTFETSSSYAIRNLIAQFLSKKLTLRRTSFCFPRETLAEASAIAFSKLQKLPSSHLGGSTARAIIRCLLSCVKYQNSFSRGALEESEMSKYLVASTESRALRYLFIAEKKIKNYNVASLEENCSVYDSKQISQRHLKIGVVGSGVMGTGIAYACLLAGYRVHLLDSSVKALDKAMENMGLLLLHGIGKKKLSVLQAQNLHRKCLTKSTEFSSLSDCDIIIEAVYESMSIKQEVFDQLNKHCSPHCILCSNTSSLDLEIITQSVNHRHRLLGLHFFSPAHLMKLVECIPLLETSRHCLQFILLFVKSLGKVGIVANNSPGFIGNRMIFVYAMESMMLVEEGNSIEAIDSALKEFGMKMGPFEMADLSGLDIGYAIRKEKGLIPEESPDCNVSMSRYSSLGDLLYQKGRLGVKNGRGFYRYSSQMVQGGISLPWPFVSKYLASHSYFGSLGVLLSMSSSLSMPSNHQNISQPPSTPDIELLEIINQCRARYLQYKATLVLSSSSCTTSCSDSVDTDDSSIIGQAPGLSSLDIVHRLLLPLINEGFRLLEEGVVFSYRPSDIDVVFLYGYGFPAYRGGPMYYAEHILTLKYVLDALLSLSKRFPGCNYFLPSPLLIYLVENNISLASLQKNPDLLQIICREKLVPSYHSPILSRL